MNLLEKSIYVRIIFAFILFSTFTSGSAQQNWTTRVGDYYDGARDIRQLPDGGYIILGEEIMGGPGAGERYLARLDAYGNLLWRKYIMEGGIPLGIDSFDLTSDGSFIMCGDGIIYDEDFNVEFCWFIMKTDDRGNTLWKKVYKIDYNIFTYCIKETLDGGFIISSTIYTDTSNSEITDVYLIRTDDRGDTLWSKAYNTPYNERWNDLRQSPDGGFVIAVSLFDWSELEDYVRLIKVDSRGDTLWTKKYMKGHSTGYHSLQLTDEGDIILVVSGGKIFHYGIMKIIKLNSSGAELWIKTLPEHIETSTFLFLGKTDDDGFFIFTILSSPYYEEARINHNLDLLNNPPPPTDLGGAYLLKLNASGEPLWSRVFKNTYIAFAARQTTDRGFILVCGKHYITEYGAENSNLLVIKIPPPDKDDQEAITNPNVIFGNYPNPFNTVTIIAYKIINSSHVNLKIYSSTGSEIKSLIDEYQEAGAYNIAWDGTNDRGVPVTSGVYISRLLVNGKLASTKKLILVK